VASSSQQKEAVGYLSMKVMMEVYKGQLLASSG